MKNVINFIDDVVITDANKEHLKNLKEVFKCISKTEFKINIKKLIFFLKLNILNILLTRIDYINPEKVAMLEIPKPKNMSKDFYH